MLEGTDYLSLLERCLPVHLHNRGVGRCFVMGGGGGGGGGSTPSYNNCHKIMGAPRAPLPIPTPNHNCSLAKLDPLICLEDHWALIIEDHDNGDHEHVYFSGHAVYQSQGCRKRGGGGTFLSLWCEPRSGEARAQNRLENTMESEPGSGEALNLITSALPPF